MKLKYPTNLFFLILLVSINLTAQPQPPLMGWASWNHFHMDISEKVIKGQADAMVSSGLKDLGYKYINIDDGFFNGRYADGTLRLDSVKFPHGMKPVADYIHDKGLKAGFYSEAGANTCGSMYDNSEGGVGGGLYGHEQQDMHLFFKTWGFDFLKVDYCGALDQHLDEETRYTAIRKAIDNTGAKNINLNICRWQFPGTWVTRLADSWRIWTDIRPEWRKVCEIIDKDTYLAPYASPGHYNDMDMLEVGRGMKPEEDKAHFSMWCMMGSPLMLGNDLSDISPSAKEIISNRELIAVNQDISGDVQARLVQNNDNQQVFVKTLGGKQSAIRAVAFLNRTPAPVIMKVNWSDINLMGKALVRDLWSHTDVGVFDSTYSVTVPAHGISVVKITANTARLQETFEGEYAWINNYNLTRYGEIVPGQGRPQKESLCSGGAKASNLGNGAENYIEFRDIYAQKAGEYTLTLHYISSNERKLVMLVNGKENCKLTGLCSHNWKTVATIKVPIKLKSGNNTIRFSNTNSWMPDIDKIHINLNR